MPSQGEQTPGKNLKRRVILLKDTKKYPAWRSGEKDNTLKQKDFFWRSKAPYRRRQELSSGGSWWFLHVHIFTTTFKDKLGNIFKTSNLCTQVKLKAGEQDLGFRCAPCGSHPTAKPSLQKRTPLARMLFRRARHRACRRSCRAGLSLTSILT